MKPVHQTIFSLPLGDCFQASVASILELPLEKVPNFNERGNEWWDAFKQWCAGIGMYPLEINVSEWTNPLRDLDWTTGYWLAGGPGPRGIPHCVVYHGDQLAHDPIPGGNGLEKIEYATALIPLDPVLILAAQKERGAEPVQCAVVPRAEVMDFARQMEVTLRRHDAQRGDSWKREGLPWLSMRVLEEASELREAVKQTPDGGYNDCIPSEAVDVGNMAMMCFSRFHALCPGAHREQEESGETMFDLNQVSANAAGLCHETIMFEHERSYERNRPFMRYGARVYQDGAAFCCCLGEFGPDCICGFGDTPDEACRKFDKAWYATAKQPAAEPVPAPMLPGESARDAFIRQTGMGDGNHD